MVDAPRALLVALSEGPNVPLEKPIVLFGRHPDCDVQLNSMKISRRHCCLAVYPDRLVARDLGSTNGLRVNGMRQDECVLRHGDEVLIGCFSYRVQLRPLPDGGESSDMPVLLSESNVPGAIPIARGPNQTERDARRA